MASNNQNNNSINIAELFQEYKSKWPWFAISVFVFVSMGVAYALLKKPVFNVHASVLISQEDQSGGAADALKQFSMGDMFGGMSTVDDELAVMSSHDVLRSTVKELGLNVNYIVREHFFKRYMTYNNEPISLGFNNAIVDTLRAHILFKVKVDDSQKVDIEVKANGKGLMEVNDKTFPVSIETDYGSFVFNKTKYFDELFNDCGSFREYISITGYDAAAEDLSEHMLIDIPSKKANVISLDYQTSYIDYGKEIVNSVISNYNKKGIAEKQQKDYKTAQFVETRLESLTEELNTAEKIIEDYKRKNDVASVEADAEYQYVRKNALEESLITAETDIEILKMTRDFILDPENRYAMIPFAKGTGADREGIEAYNNLILERIKLENNAKGNNVSLQAISKQIDSMRENIIETIKKTYDSSIIRLNELRSQYNQSQAKLSNIPIQERQYLSMMRQQTIKQELFLFLLQKQEETALNIANTMSRGQVIDEAYAFNEPVSASKKIIVFMFFILGLLAPVGYFYVRNLLRNKFSTKEELEKKTSVPILGEICTSKRNDVLVVKNGGSTSAAELFRLVRSNLQFVLNDNSDKVILTTSTIAGEGKSFVSINLAASFAMLGKKVCLVGMDIRKPQLANYLSLPTGIGLTQYLSSDQYSLTDIIIKAPVMENFDIIQAGPIPPNPAELLISEKVDEMFSQLRSMYDYIIIDSAPVGMVSDTFALVRVSDATVYVCRANHSTTNEIKFFNNLYENYRLKKMALVVNGTQSRKGYGYGY